RAVHTTDNDLAAIVDKEKLEQLNPEFGTNPRVWYKNLYRYNKCFVGGSIEVQANGAVDCLPGATVTLRSEERIVAECKTDIYGDFKLDDLEENSGSYELQISAEGYLDKSMEFELGESLYLGEITLSK
ncbi:MAG: hypothetical protein ACR2OW_11200, partial [Methyloligellaceae bacterium]